MSWTAGEFSSETSMDKNFVSNGVTYLAASGDAGTGAAYPAASPDVIGVGGTSLYLNASGNYQSETAWSGSGGGLSFVRARAFVPIEVRNRERSARLPRRA